MANLNAPLGFRAVTNRYNAAPIIETYQVTAAIEIFEGEPVCIAATGLVVKYTDALAIAGNIVGVAAHYVSAAQTDRELKVYGDPNQLFELIADDATITALAGYRGALFDIVNPTTGNALTGQSNCALDASSAAVSIGTDAASLRSVRCEDVVRAADNEQGVAFTRYQVRFVPPVHHKGMASVGFNSTADFKGI